MKRKVIKQGNGTLTMTLPKKWADSVGLTENSELDIIEQGHSIQVTSSSAQKGTQIEISLDSNNRTYIRQVLNNIYLTGYDEVNVIDVEPGSLKTIREVIEDLLGYQIIQYSRNSCLIRNLSKEDDTEFSALLRRIFLLVKLQLDLMIEDFSGQKLDNHQQLFEIGKSIHRFVYYCRRLLIKTRMFSNYKSTRMYLLITRLLTISHSVEYLYDSLSGSPVISKQELEYCKDTAEYFQLFYSLFYQLKHKSIYKLSEGKEDLLDQRLLKLLSSKSSNHIVIHYCAQIIRDIARNGGILFTLKDEHLS
ncbi:MAG: hypothetical protein KJ601_01840 [Nanoarchaeota archaeon]|nr:hypothetical protein [Nanoarchaeota archaeon]MBU1704408.1 hypothetical protein [Nanoarchaeota archaeon]